MPLTTWTKIAINNTEVNGQGAFDAANSRFVAPAAGTYLFGASLLYKVNSSTTARMNGRLVMNGSTEIKGGKGENSATHVSLATTLTLQTLVPLTPGDTVELQGYFRDGSVCLNTSRGVSKWVGRSFRQPPGLASPD